MSVAAFYKKHKKHWDELITLNGEFICTCGRMVKCSCIERMSEMENKNRLMQFLLKLRSDFDGARSQILVMDPLPNVNRAYFIVQQIEAQQNITRKSFEPSAFMASTSRNPQVYRRDFNKGRVEDKKFYTHCKNEGHEFDQCFERIGYPDWFKRKKGRKPARFIAHVKQDDRDEAYFNTSFDEDKGADVIVGRKEVDASLVTAVCQEMYKMLRNSGNTTMQSTSMNFIGTTCYSSRSLNHVLGMEFKEYEWVVDTGALEHITPYLHILFDVKKLINPIRIVLPDGSVKSIIIAGKACLRDKLFIEHVLYVPEFNHNLLSTLQVSVHVAYNVLLHIG